MFLHVACAPSHSVRELLCGTIATTVYLLAETDRDPEKARTKQGKIGNFRKSSLA